MRKTGAKDRVNFAKKAGKTWLDPMCTPVKTRQIKALNKDEGASGAGNRQQRLSDADTLKKEPEAMKKENRRIKKRNWSKWVEPDVFSFIKKNKSL